MERRKLWNSSLFSGTVGDVTLTLDMRGFYGPGCYFGMYFRSYTNNLSFHSWLVHVGIIISIGNRLDCLGHCTLNEFWESKKKKIDPICVSMLPMIFFYSNALAQQVCLIMLSASNIKLLRRLLNAYLFNTFMTKVTLQMLAFNVICKVAIHSPIM